jgi:hypothetical protein
MSRWPAVRGGQQAGPHEGGFVVVASSVVMTSAVWGVSSAVGSFYFLMIAGRGRRRGRSKK